MAVKPRSTMAAQIELGTDETDSGRWRAGLVLVVVAVLAMAGRFLNAPAFLDDSDEMSYVRGFSRWTQAFGVDCYGFLRPIKNLIFVAANGLPAVGTLPWRLLSITLYLACVLLSFAWFRRRLTSGSWAVAATAVWALAPTQVSAVAWFSCANILAGTACVLGMSLLYDRLGELPDDTPATRRRGLTAAILLLYAMALGSYEGMVIAPLLLMVQGMGIRPSRRRIAWVPFVAQGALLVLFVLLRASTRSGLRVSNESFGPMAAWQVTAASAWLTMDHVLVYLWPFGHQSITGTFVWGQSAPVWALAIAWLAAAGLLALAFGLRRRTPLIWLGVVWFALAFLPTSNLLPFRNGPYADYYLVLPSLGGALAIVALARHLASLPVTVALPKVALALVLLWRGAAAVAAFDWAQAWNHDEVIYQRTLAARPAAFTARASLARSALVAGRLDEAKALAVRATQEGPWHGQAFYVLGDVYVKQGRVREAIATYQEAQRARPSGTYPLYAIGYLQETALGDPAGAERNYRAVLRAHWNQSAAGATLRLALLMMKQRRLVEATDVVESALKHEPANPKLHLVAAACWNERGDHARADEHGRLYERLSGK